MRLSQLLIGSSLLMTSSASRAHDRISTEVTYAREVARILGAQCVSCHGDRDAIPLTRYAEVRPWAKAIRDEVESGRMPPWPPVRGVGDLATGRVLAPRAAEILIAWAEGGAPEGDPRDLPDAGAVVLPTPMAGANLVRVRRTLSLTKDVWLHAVRPTAAARSSVEVRAILASGAQVPLVWIRRFDPRWAGSYPLRAPLRLPAGSRVVVFGERGAGAELTVREEAPAPAR